MIKTKLPETKVLLLGIFPRGPRKDKTGAVVDDGVAKMKIIHAVNDDLAKLDDGKTVRFLDISKHFLGNDGTIPDILMPDQLHPNAAGYQLWADAMKPLLAEMLKS
jgi:lysophospholipase L1-like esterase